MKFFTNRRTPLINDYHTLYDGFKCIIIYKLKDNSLKYKIYKTYPQIFFNKWDIFEIYVKDKNKWISYKDFINKHK